jgi:multidrug efflux system membrane fusion protein
MRQATQALAGANGQVLEACRETFADRDRLKIEVDRRIVKDELLRAIPPGGSNYGPKKTWTDTALLRNEFAKQARFTPVRSVLMRAAHSVQTLKPCFMMSPLSLAKFLTPERLVNIGDEVTPGMTLARLDSTDYRLSLESAEAEVKAAQSSLKQAEADERRNAALNEKGVVSDASYDKKKAAADEARGRAERALRSLALASNQLAYTDLVATETGVVTALPVEVGQVVSAGQLIARVARLDELEAVVSIPESRIDGDRTAAATVTLWADGGRVYDAKLREVSPQADPATRTYRARYSLIRPDAAITLGKTATVHLASPGAGERAKLPLAAVFKDQGRPSVWLIDEARGRLIKTSVEVSAWTETSAIIFGGLTTGEKVVAAGVHKLDAGTPVRIVEVVQ